MRKILLSLSLLLTLLPSSCQVNYPTSDAAPVDHTPWTELLRKHVTADGWVDYAELAQDSKALNSYLTTLSRSVPNPATWSRQEQLAYWINAYNAFTVQLIIQHYPVESIKDIKSGLAFVNSVWDIKFIELGGEPFDLNNIEHGILRRQFEEPRIHFAINCASVSCPKLLNEAYTAGQLDAQLTAAATTFLADPYRNIIGREAVQLSKIFTWFGGDFKRSGSLIDYLNQYAPVKIDADAEIDYLDYDWRLNIAANDPAG